MSTSNQSSRRRAPWWTSLLAHPPAEGRYAEGQQRAQSIFRQNVERPGNPTRRLPFASSMTAVVTTPASQMRSC